MTPYCKADGSACVACNSNAQCGGETPICNQGTNTCSGCLVNSDCAAPNPVCYGGQCVRNGACPLNGSTVSYDGLTYDLIWIDINNNNTEEQGECWFKENIASTQTKMSDNSLRKLDLGADYVCVAADNRTDSDCLASTGGKGYLYTWVAAYGLLDSCYMGPCDDSLAIYRQGVCPPNWHVATDVEWNQMEMALTTSGPCNGDRREWGCDGAGYALKTKGYGNGLSIWPWFNSNIYNTNSSGFSAVAAGYYMNNYNMPGEEAFFWTNEVSEDSAAFARHLEVNNAAVDRPIQKRVDMLSVRCVHD